ncbi:MAG: glycoside hydrolase family 2 TIM barrel-domain containing protein [Chitinophagaceae bacterium]
MRFKLLFCLSLFFSIAVCAQSPNIWSKEKANAWYKKQGWLVGADFLPSTAINQLEMWQAETFDPVTIDRELGWAQNIGMNVMRVYLHDLAWKEDANGFKRRMKKYLEIASKHKIKTLFTIFDDCWNPDPVVGKQPDPKPGVHNSGWVRSPGKSVHEDPSQWGYLESYVKDILTTFKNDNRILMWDLYNEPGNSKYDEGSFSLLKKVFAWAWAVRPSQPLTAATWADYKNLNAFQLESSDVITIHNYNDAADLEKELKEKTALGRPVICSEYMARPRNSRFKTHLPIFKKYNVGAINWGLVAGKSNTIYQWSKPIPDGSEPELWFHDVFRKDGTPYDKSETDFIKTITAK